MIITTLNNNIPVGKSESSTFPMFYKSSNKEGITANADLVLSRRFL